MPCTVTPHQLRMLATKAQFGLADKQVARRFGIKPSTVRNSFCKLRKTIGARNNPHAVALLWPILAPLMTAPTPEEQPSEIVPA